MYLYGVPFRYRIFSLIYRIDIIFANYTSVSILWGPRTRQPRACVVQLYPG